MYWSIIIKLLVGMIGVLIFLRLSGKSQMANLTVLNSVNSIVLGALIGSIIYMPKSSVWILVFAMFVWFAINLLLNLLLKNGFFNRLINGQTDLLIKDGKIDLKVLKRNKMTIEQFRAKLRESEIYSLLDVDDVRFETDGHITIFRRKSHPESFLLISNGEIIKETLEESGKDEKWLIKQLDSLGFSDMKKLFCVEYTPERGFYIITDDGKIMNKSNKSEVKELDDDVSV